jgi:hypothetical protein
MWIRQKDPSQNIHGFFNERDFKTINTWLKRVCYIIPNAYVQSTARRTIQNCQIALIDVQLNLLYSKAQIWLRILDR